MSPTAHAVISAATSATIFLFTKSWSAALTCFFGGILIDVDHVLDFIFHHKRIPKTYKELFEFCTYQKDGKLTLVFHSYEFLIPFWLIVFWLRPSDIWLGLAAGLLTHMAADQITNPMNPRAYFLTYRMKVGFARKKIFTDEYYKSLQ